LLRGCQGVCRVCRVCRVFLVTDTAQIELKIGRVLAPGAEEGRARPPAYE